MLVAVGAVPMAVPMKPTHVGHGYLSRQRLVQSVRRETSKFMGHSRLLIRGQVAGLTALLSLENCGHCTVAKRRCGRGCAVASSTGD